MGTKRAVLPLAAVTAEDLIRLERVRVQRRMNRLAVWIRHPSFAGATWSERRDAKAEARSIHDDLVVLRLRIRSYENDVQNVESAMDWVRADKAETVSELFTTMSKIIPIHSNETPEAYYERLRAIREAFANLEVPELSEEDGI
jgi:hypothetical protein